MNDETRCEYVCSRGILKSCKIKSKTIISSIKSLINYDFTNFVSGDTIYVANSAMKEFVKIIDFIPGNFVLVSGDSDDCTPTEQFNSKKDFLNFIENSQIIHWYSQNCVSQHPKLSHIPIGLDYHTIYEKNVYWGKKQTPWEQEQTLKKIISSSKPFWERKTMCYGNFHFFCDTRFGFDRKNAIHQIPEELIFYEPKPVEREVCWMNQIQYAFVVSPSGEGFDCHRTWEALCLGCIAIVKKSHIDPVYEDLPVWIVDDWSDITMYNLQKIIHIFKNKKFNYEKLKLKFWVDKINGHK